MKILLDTLKRLSLVAFVIGAAGLSGCGDDEPESADKNDGTGSSSSTTPSTGSLSGSSSADYGTFADAQGALRLSVSLDYGNNVLKIPGFPPIKMMPKGDSSYIISSVLSIDGEGEMANGSIKRPNSTLSYSNLCAVGSYVSFDDKLIIVRMPVDKEKTVYKYAYLHPLQLFTTHNREVAISFKYKAVFDTEEEAFSAYTF